MSQLSSPVQLPLGSAAAVAKPSILGALHRGAHGPHIVLAAPASYGRLPVCSGPSYSTHAGVVVDAGAQVVLVSFDAVEQPTRSAVAIATRDLRVFIMRHSTKAVRFVS